MSQCPNPTCGVQNPAGSKFCMACGSSLAARSAGSETVVATPPHLPANPARVSVRVTDPHYSISRMPLEPVRPDPVAYAQNRQREHMILIIDHSGSMNEAYDGGLIKLEAVKRAMMSLIIEREKLDAQDEIGLVMFDDHAVLLMPPCPVGTYKRHLIQSVQSVQIDGGTDINAGLKTARKAFDWSRRDVVRRIVLQTDGHGGHPLRTAEDLKAHGVVIDVMGVGHDPSAVNEKLLRQVASVVNGETHYWFLKDQKTLLRTVRELSEKTQVR
jgi:Mg-chelatase subunit ChlD